MAKFATPADVNTELGGNLGDLKDNFVSLQALGGLITVKTKFGPQQAIRTQVVDPLTGADLGVRLLFWGSLQTQLTGIHAKGLDWLVGFIHEHPQKDDPTKTFFIVDAPTPEDEIDWHQVEVSLDAFEQNQLEATMPQLAMATVAATDESQEAPF